MTVNNDVSPPESPSPVSQKKKASLRSFFHAGRILCIGKLSFIFGWPFFVFWITHYFNAWDSLGIHRAPDDNQIFSEKVETIQQTFLSEVRLLKEEITQLRSERDKSKAEGGENHVSKDEKDKSDGFLEERILNFHQTIGQFFLLRHVILTGDPFADLFQALKKRPLLSPQMEKFLTTIEPFSVTGIWAVAAIKGRYKNLRSLFAKELLTEAQHSIWENIRLKLLAWVHLEKNGKVISFFSNTLTDLDQAVAVFDCGTILKIVKAIEMKEENQEWAQWVQHIEAHAVLRNFFMEENFLPIHSSMPISAHNNS